MTRPWTITRIRTFAVSMALTLLACLIFAPLAHAEWYEGGTLHRANGHAWVKGTEANRLATASDFAVAVVGERNVTRSLKTFNEFRPYAAEMKACIDGMYNAAEERRAVMRAKPASEIAALCASYVEGMWGRR